MGKNAVNRWYMQASTRWPYDDERSDDHHHTFSDVPHLFFNQIGAFYIHHAAPLLEDPT